MKLKHFADLILRLIFPARCAVCDELLPYTKIGELCESCASAVESERNTVCSRCGRHISDCTCTTLDNGRAPISLMFYTKQNDRAVEKLVFHLKDDKTSLAYRFFAREISREILLVLAKSFEIAGDYTVTYTPRSDAKLNERGFDQGERLAKAVAEFTGMKYEKLFTRSEASEQKSLNASERIANASTIHLLPSADVKGKHIFIIDDIITTGATMNAAAKLLTEAGADMVRIASAFRTMPQNKNCRMPKTDNSLWFEE